MNYKEALDYIENTLKFGSILGLDRIKAILKEMGNPQDSLKIIHVAGTNGKGSVCAMITEMLMQAGYKVGLFISPHIEDFRERIQVNREYISEDDIVVETKKVKSVIETLVSNGMDQPTEFEIVTAMMFSYFKRMNLDYAVIEVGLGGLLDSTNVLNPLLSVITHISYDHEKVLGNTLTEIASNKAGIIKNAPVISYPQESEAREVILNKAKEMNVRVFEVKKQDSKFLSFSKEKGASLCEFRFKDKTFTSYLNLIGTHQLINASVAIKAIEVLKDIEGKSFKMDEEIIKKALSVVKWMGRFEKVKQHPLMFLDGAHNPDGMTVLKESMNKFLEGRNYHLILGILADKNIDQMIDIIAKDAKQVYCVTPDSLRAELSNNLNLKVLKVNKNSEAFTSYEEALKEAITNCLDDEYIMIAGSLYMIGDMRKIISRNDFR